MKKWIAMMLALLMVLSLAACGDIAPTTTAGKQEPTNGSTPTGSTPVGSTPTGSTPVGSTPAPTEPSSSQPPELTDAETILAAIESTRNAKSFTVRFGRVTEFMGEKEEEIGNIYMMVDAEGKVTGLVTSPFVVWETGETIDATLYINGDVGYELDPYMEMGGDFGHYKHTGSGLGQELLFADLEGFVTNPEFLAQFCAGEMKTETLDNGDIRYQLADATIAELMELLSGEPVEGEPNMDGVPIQSLTLAIDLTESGYLSKISYAIGVYMEGMQMTMECFVDVDRHNETLDIQTPAFIAERESGKGWNQYHIHENGYEAVYQVDVEDGEAFCSFEGMENDYDSTQVIPVYKVLKEVDGLTVKYVQDVSTNSFQNTAYIEKLILPEGVAYRGWEDREHTQLFFESEEGSVENEFYVIGEEENYYAGVKAAYYAGEWEYVDGVPTPKE